MNPYALILTAAIAYALTRWKHHLRARRVAREHKAFVVNLREEHAAALAQAYRNGVKLNRMHRHPRIERLKELAQRRGALFEQARLQVGRCAAARLEGPWN